MHFTIYTSFYRYCFTTHLTNQGNMIFYSMWPMISLSTNFLQQSERFLLKRELIPQLLTTQNAVSLLKTAHLRFYLTLVWPLFYFLQDNVCLCLLYTFFFICFQWLYFKHRRLDLWTIILRLHIFDTISC